MKSSSPTSRNDLQCDWLTGYLNSTIFYSTIHIHSLYIIYLHDIKWSGDCHEDTAGIAIVGATTILHHCELCQNGMAIKNSGNSIVSIRLVTAQ